MGGVKPRPPARLTLRRTFLVQSQKNAKQLSMVKAASAQSKTSQTGPGENKVSITDNPSGKLNAGSEIFQAESAWEPAA